MAYIQVGGGADGAAGAAPSPSRFALGRRRQAHAGKNKQNKSTGLPKSIEELFGKYFNVQVICIFDFQKQRYLWSKSSGWQIPSEDIEIIKNVDLDDYLRKKGITCAEDLLGADYSRAESIAQATEFALASQKLL